MLADIFCVKPATKVVRNKHLALAPKLWSKFLKRISCH